MKKKLFLLLTLTTMLFTGCIKESETIKGIENPQEENVRTSTDYSADGKVTTLQKATIEGATPVPIVFVGDGFADTDIASGEYERVVKKAMENLFSIEPFTSLRNYFDVYAVTVVSQNNAFGDNYETALECVLDDNGGTRISGNTKQCQTYAIKVPDLNLHETLIITIINDNRHAGSTDMILTSGGNFVNLGIVFCPIVENKDSESFKKVMLHEVAHGYAKLLDEYATEENGTIPQKEITDIKERQEKYNWHMNIATTSNVKEVPWAKFIEDNRYSWENLGVYEGGSGYIKGAYRSTNESLMKSDFYYFNAPSREAIYRRTLKTAHGDSFAYDYETFVTFDSKYHDKLKKEVAN